MEKKRKKIAIVVGHNSRFQGAMYKPYNLTEYTFNSVLAAKMLDYIEESVLFKSMMQARVFERKFTITEVIERVNKWKPDLIIELHCNSWNGRVEGREALYWWSSDAGKKLGINILEEVGLSLENRNRGVKAVKSEERGWKILSKTNAPCVILEPFFIDKKTEVSKAILYMSSLAYRILLGIGRYINDK